MLLPGATPSPSVVVVPQRDLDARESWGGIRQGLSADEVERMLGVPDRKQQIGAQTIWYYDYKILGSGTVALDAGGQVSGFVKPYFNLWF